MNNELNSVYLDSFKDAVRSFQDALIAPKNELSRDAAIKRFELAFELSWKLLQRYLREQGLDCQSPKSCYQAGLANKLVTNEEVATVMIADRNFSVHTYNEKFAEELFSRLPKYQAIFDDLIKTLEN
ncbi:MAG: nucleotidyltransferase substrate binding protein [Candidatus Berkelbacteria bacterium]|nr:nucleotidyltransferase substrate binding protein [Candidatus Berkelbacteria bacterium]MCR4307195.1 nucleotidyltransferase substrate binding protein [Candidatus Berkelbacteria bacterium]